MSKFFGDNHDCGCVPPYDKNHCQFGVWAPWYHSPVENTAFNLYAMSIEEERENQENEDDNYFWG